MKLVKNVVKPATATQILDALGVSKAERRTAGALAAVIAKSRAEKPRVKRGRSTVAARGAGRVTVSSRGRSVVAKAKRARVR